MEKILIVDDIKSNRILLRKTLIAVSDYQIIEANDGKQAITKYTEENPDLILMDINMPEMDGYQSAAAIKAQMGEDYIPIIFVTALNDESSLSHALAAGGDDFICKPFNTVLLKSKILAHLRIRELNQKLNERNNQLALHNQRLTNEQELIENFFHNTFQKNFLDKNIIKHHMSSMSAFNGDLFLTAISPTGGMYIVMGDFTGHGLTAAMGTLPVAMIFFKLASKSAAIGDIAREINYQLNMLIPKGMFFAATLLEVNPQADAMSVWMGGMPESYWFGKNGELKGTIHSQHMPLGIQENDQFNAEVEVFNIEPSDKLYIYSDGITEACNPDGEMFGNNRLKEILTTQGDNRFDAVLHALKTFTGVNDQADDITLVEMTCRRIPPENKMADHNKQEHSALPWNLSITLSANDMRSKNPVNSLSEILGTLPILAKHKGILHVVLSEIYSNTLEHSILGLDSCKKSDDEQFTDYYQEREKQLQMLENAFITFDLRFDPKPNPQSLKIRITDSGTGYRKQSLNAPNNRLHGRGLEIINSFCERVTFSEDGKSLEALYRI
jgi:CheY-like chemotaxis protein